MKPPIIPADLYQATAYHKQGKQPFGGENIADRPDDRRNAILSKYPKNNTQ